MPNSAAQVDAPRVTNFPKRDFVKKPGFSKKAGLLVAAEAEFSLGSRINH